MRCARRLPGLTTVLRLGQSIDVGSQLTGIPLHLGTGPGVANGDHAVDLHVPVKDALDDQRRGQGIKDRHLHRLVAPTLGVLLQAAAVLVTDLFNGPRQALEQVPAISNVHASGQAVIAARL